MNEPGSDRLQASCHCGNIRVAIDWPDRPASLPVRACGCGFCMKHGAAWTSTPNGRFRLHVAEDSGVTRYRLGTNTADFHVCSTCGAVPIVTCVIEGARYAVVNANTFDAVRSLHFARVATDFEAETRADRLMRRRRNWTPEATGNKPRQPA